MHNFLVKQLCFLEHPLRNLFLLRLLQMLILLIHLQQLLVYHPRILSRHIFCILKAPAE